MAEHTPGKWKVEGQRIKDSKGNTLADMRYAANTVVTGNYDLVAAAPKMLEALKALYEETADYIRINNLGDVHHNRSMQLARDAIRLAGGK